MIPIIIANIVGLAVTCFTLYILFRVMRAIEKMADGIGKLAEKDDVKKIQ